MLVALATTTSALAVGCGGSSGGSSSASARRTTIAIDGYQFGPQKVTVKAGDSVTWANHEGPGVEHTASAQDGTFDTGGIAPGASKTFRLVKPGSYPYHCDLHPFMHGEVIVH